MAINRCEICGKEITATESVNRGVGSKDAAKYAAGIQAAGCSFAQIEAFVALDDSFVTERVRRAKLAIGRGRIGDAKFFLVMASKHLAALPLVA